MTEPDSGVPALPQETPPSAESTVPELAPLATEQRDQLLTENPLLALLIEQQQASQRAFAEQLKQQQEQLTEVTSLLASVAVSGQTSSAPASEADKDEDKIYCDLYLESNPFPAPPRAGQDPALAKPQRYRLYGDETYDNLSKARNVKDANGKKIDNGSGAAVHEYANLVPALFYLHGVQHTGRLMLGSSSCKSCAPRPSCRQRGTTSSFPGGSAVPPRSGARGGPPPCGGYHYGQLLAGHDGARAHRRRRGALCNPSRCGCARPYRTGRWSPRYLGCGARSTATR